METNRTDVAIVTVYEAGSSQGIEELDHQIHGQSFTGTQKWIVLAFQPLSHDVRTNGVFNMTEAGLSERHQAICWALQNDKVCADAVLIMQPTEIYPEQYVERALSELKTHDIVVFRNNDQEKSIRLGGIAVRGDKVNYLHRAASENLSGDIARDLLELVRNDNGFGALVDY
jgi:hypothetical protein